MAEMTEAIQLFERLVEDQRRCWLSGQPRKVEQYLVEFPSLTKSETVLLDFIYAEFRLRQECGETVEIGEYQDRFPHLKTNLSRLFEAHCRLVVNAPGLPGAESKRDRLEGLATQNFYAADNPAADSAPTPLAPGEKVGRYRVEAELGSGNFGSVYLATDEELRRSVAVKILRQDRLVGNAEEQFLDEARTVARLKHPLIVPIYDVGHHEDGRPYAVMEFVEGRSLKEFLAGCELPSPVQAAELIATIAEAIDHAHREGFVHRDLKPANILLDNDGRPHVLDFGLAIHESSQRDRPGERAGTLAYMAPEQVRRESDSLDGRSDIWALGMMLYEMLTGRRPFDGINSEKFCDEILHREPKPPRQINDTVPEELEQICLKCLRKDVSERYLTARDLARDLRRAVKPRHSVQPWLWAAAALAGMFLATVAWWVESNRAREPSPKAAALQGKIDIRVWKADDPDCQDISVADPKARPLRAGDRFSIQTALSRPAYLYVLDIDGRGNVTPLYPWQPGNWHTLPSEQKPVERVSLPEANRLGKIKPPGGMETLVLLARESALKDDAELLALLPEIPPQSIRDKGAIFILTNGQRDDLVDVAAGGGTRSYDISDSTQDDAALDLLHMLHERLAPRFPLVRTITVANMGE